MNDSVKKTRNKVLYENGWNSIKKSHFSKCFTSDDIPKLLEIYQKTKDPLVKAYRGELLGALDKAIVESNSSDLTIQFFQKDYFNRKLKRGVKQDQIVWARAPIRLDLAGGWTDTPPHTNRFGGKVTNIAVNLNGQPPVQVFIRPTTELHIRLHSIDLGVTETITDISQILDYTNPSSPYALPKAALTLLGLVPDEKKSGPIEEKLKEIGCGIEITLLCAVPKGSGLGTSSILGGVILTALERFFDIQSTPDDLFLQVLEMEQMLTTGGGWQDQIGGIVGGVKYIESKPGLIPHPLVYQLDSRLFDDHEYKDRMTLYYTGITRLAKNILQEVVSQSNSFEPDYLETLDTIAELAEKARRIISLRDLEGLAGILEQSWQKNLLIHPSTTNDEVNRVFEDTKDLYIGKKLLGAGGGGYGLFISSDRYQADALKERLEKDFDNDRSRVVDFDLNHEGMVVTVS